MELERGDAGLLAEIGFLGISRGEICASDRIFSALNQLRPHDEAGPVGLAMAALGAGKIDMACKVLGQAPQSEAVIAFSVVAYAMAGDRPQAETLFEDLTAMHAVPDLIAIAQAALHTTPHLLEGHTR